MSGILTPLHLTGEVALIMISAGLAIIAVDVVGLLALLDALSRLTDGLTALLIAASLLLH